MKRTVLQNGESRLRNDPFLASLFRRDLPSADNCVVDLPMHFRNIRHAALLALG